MEKHVFYEESSLIHNNQICSHLLLYMKVRYVNFEGFLLKERKNSIKKEANQLLVNFELSNFFIADPLESLSASLSAFRYFNLRSL